MKVACGLALGTADPHLLGGAADSVPRPRRGATFDPIAHLQATEEALRSRPLPATNEPPETKARAEPEAPPTSPPVVRQVEQVVPTRTLRRVRQWMRQLRRCLRFAESGDTAMARRLRPDDLWLPHASNSVPETAAWDWDLRPLEAGEPQPSRFNPRGATV